MPADDSLERLSKKLDAGTSTDGIRRSDLYSKTPPAPSEWHTVPPPPPETTLLMTQKRRLSSLERIFIGSGVFFVIALVIAALLFFTGQNTVSTKNVEVQVSGPTQIGAGNTLSLQIVVTNHNAVPMQLTDLVVEFPDGTRSDTNITQPLPRIRQTLGTINPGESVNRTVKAVIFGKTDTDISVKASAEYRVPSSNAIFVSDTTYTAHINEAPVAIAVTNLKEAVSGQNATVTVAITSNSPQVLKDMLLVALYPPGFTFKSATPSPAFGKNVFGLGDIEPDGTRTVTIQGVFTGEDGDVRVMNFTIGNRQHPSDTAIAAPLATAEADVIVTKPFISAALSVNDAVSDTHTITRGQIINGEIEWTNNLPVSIQNLQIELDFTGAILDKNKVTSREGFFRSANSSIVWDTTTVPQFANVVAGQSGTLPFSFATLPISAGTFKNPEIDLKVSLHASRQSETSVPESVDSTTGTKTFVASDLTLSGVLGRNTVFTDTGPIPPKVDRETTYTITWILGSSANALANTRVTAALPTYVRFVGAVSPGTQSVSFDTNSSVVTWNAGDVNVGAPKSVSFQIGLTPSISQETQAPVLISNQNVTAFDRFVQSTVQSSAPDVTTLSGGTSQQQGLVVP